MKNTKLKLKKALAITLSVIMATSAIALPFSVSGAQLSDNTSAVGYNVSDVISDDNGIEYTYVETFREAKKWYCWEVTDYNGTSPELIIPANYNGTVASIGHAAFQNRNDIVYVMFPSTLFRIKNYAFNGCSNLTKVTFNSYYEMETIGKYAFADCTSLQTISIPSSTNIIYDYAFKDCINLENVFLSDYVSPDTIKTGAFSGCVNLKQIVFNSYTKNIGSYAFENCRSLTNFQIPGNVTVIEDGTFAGCTGLKSILIPESVTSISDTAFDGCTNLSIIGKSGSTAESYAQKHGFDFYATDKNSIETSDFSYIMLNDETAQITSYKGTSSKITIPANIGKLLITSIGYEAFKNNSTITDVTIPDTITDIRMYAFNNCTNLKSIQFGNGIKSIHKSVFAGCVRLSDIYIPNNDMDIDVGAFNDTAFYKNSHNWDNECLRLGTYLIKVKTDVSGSYEVDDFIENIAGGAFKNCTKLTSINIPSSVIHLGTSAFEGCSGITEFSLPDSIESLGSGVFSRCTGITSFTVPKKVTTISKSLFEGCTNLKDISLDKSVTVIDDNAFTNCTSLKSLPFKHRMVRIGNSAFEGCTGITSIEFNEPILNIGDYAFFGCSNFKTLSINNKIYKLGKYAFSGCSRLEALAVNDVVQTIDNEAFFACLNLKEVAFNASVFNIGANVFKGNKNIETVIINHKIKTIGQFAFSNCTKLNNLQFNADIVDIEKGAFEYCTSLEKVIIPDGTQILRDGVFQNCTNLSMVSLGNGITRIDPKLFYKCENLTDVRLGNNVNKITANSFAYCSSLTYIVFPESLQDIFDDAFYRCTSLKSVYIPKSTKTIYKDSFDSNAKLTICGYPGSYSESYVKSLRNENFKFFPIKGSTKQYLISDLDLKNKTITLQGYLGNETIVTLPSTINGYAVTAIGKNAIQNRDDITNVILPYKLQEIKYNAFKNCPELLTISISANINSISYDSFKNCPKLTLLGFTDSSAEEFAKNNSISFKPLNAGINSFLYSPIDDTTAKLIKYIGYKTSVTIPDTADGYKITAIDDYAFKDNTQLVNVDIPESVTSIGYQAFYNTPLFYNQEKWTDGILYADNHLIKADYPLSDITVKNGTVSIAKSAFEGCTDLVSITIPDTACTIESNAFKDCTNLNKIIIPASVTKIANDAFKNCKAFAIHGYTGSYAQTYAKEISVQFVDLNGEKAEFEYTILSDGTISIHNYLGNDSELVIPSIYDGYTISTIANDTFRDCTFINSLVLPDTIREVGSNAFNGCVNLNKIVLSSGITKIYADTFYNTAYYNNIKNWEDNVLYIGEYLIKATANCIGEYTVKDTATTIAINALSDCKKLELIFIPKNVVVIGSNSLPYYAKICGYSNTAAEEYKIHYNRTFCYLDDETKNFIYNPIAPHSAEITKYTGISEKVVIPENIDGYNIISLKGGFSGKQIKEISIPDTVIYIAINTFYNCGYYNDPNNWEDGVLYIGKYLIKVREYKNGMCRVKDGTVCLADYAFNHCTYLKQVYIPESVKNTGSATFNDTTAEIYTSPNSCVQKIVGSNRIKDLTTPAVFTYNTLNDGTVSITGVKKIASKVVIPSTLNGYTVSAVAENAFKNNIFIDEVIIPETVKTIGESAFAGCKYLQKIEIANSVETISPNTFDGCINLVINGYAGSCAEEHAKVNNIKFVDITPVKYIMGDIDLDGQITILDVTLLQRYCAEQNKLTNIQLSVADLDGDKDININDATAIQRKIAE